MLLSILLFDLIELFQDFGISGALLILFAIIVFILLRNSSKRIRELEQSNLATQKFTQDALKKLMDNNDNNAAHLVEKFKNYPDNANKIMIQLYHILQGFGVNRVSIYEFHNGGKNLQGVEFKKCSNTYEAVALETKPIIKEMQNLPISMNPLWCKLLATKDDILISSVDALEDTFFKSYLQSQSIRAIYLSILLEYDNTPIGFISLEYYNNIKQLTQNEIDELNDISNRISVLINLK
jgi:hypothetical protein